MSIYKRINDSKNDKEAFESIIAYVTKKPYTVWETDVGTVGCRKEAVLQDMTAVKQSFHKNSGRQYNHAVLSITPDYPTLKDSDYIDDGVTVTTINNFTVGGTQRILSEALHMSVCSSSRTVYTLLSVTCVSTRSQQGSCRAL